MFKETPQGTTHHDKDACFKCKFCLNHFFLESHLERHLCVDIKTLKQWAKEGAEMQDRAINNIKENQKSMNNKNVFMPKTNEREWESKLRNKFQDFADSIVWSNDTGDEKYIGVGNMCDWWIKEMSQLELDTIARCAEVARNKKKDMRFSSTIEPHESHNRACDDIATAITSLKECIPCENGICSIHSTK